MESIEMRKFACVLLAIKLSEFKLEGSSILSENEKFKDVLRNAKFLHSVMYDYNWRDNSTSHLKKEE
jgi:hypothetical protein